MKYWMIFLVLVVSSILSSIVFACHSVLDEDRYLNEGCSGYNVYGIFSGIDSNPACMGKSLLSSYFFNSSDSSCSLDVFTDRWQVDSWNSLAEGDECDTYWGLTCENHNAGYYDSASHSCVIKCDGAKQSTDSDALDYCGSSNAGNGLCEHACGADTVCDEKAAGYGINTNVYCDSDCTHYTCSSSLCGTIISGTNITCVYDTSWKWVYSQNKPITFCCEDDDCPAQNHIKGICPNYNCVWYNCTSDLNCTTDYFCYCGGNVCYDRFFTYNFTFVGCPKGYCCNRGYGGTGIGKCVTAGTIFKNYLCIKSDPPASTGLFIFSPELQFLNIAQAIVIMAVGIFIIIYLLLIIFKKILK